MQATGSLPAEQPAYRLGCQACQAYRALYNVPVLCGCTLTCLPFRPLFFRISLPELANLTIRGLRMMQTLMDSQKKLPAYVPGWSLGPM